MDKQGILSVVIRPQLLYVLGIMHLSMCRPTTWGIWSYPINYIGKIQSTRFRAPDFAHSFQGPVKSPSQTTFQYVSGVVGQHIEMVHL